jgi:steroid 5-alpha reductase family enzyme
MALPAVRTLAECADFTQTVSPYLYQLYDLPQQLLQSYSDPTELRNLYLATNPVISGLAFSLLLAPIFLIVSEINRNFSQVDRCWSILPTVYNAHFAIYARMSGLPTERLDYLLAFSVVWSVCNFIYPKFRI